MAMECMLMATDCSFQADPIMATFRSDCPIRRAQASSLLGNAYSLMIATISPTAAAIKHTRNTLHYAGTASTITLAPPKTVEDDAEVRRLPGNYLIASKLPDCLSNDLPDDLSQCLSNDLPDDLSQCLSDDLPECHAAFHPHQVRNAELHKENKKLLLELEQRASDFSELQVMTSDDL